MYQLSHMLTEQKALINDQVEMNIFGSDKGKCYVLHIALQVLHIYSSFLAYEVLCAIQSFTHIYGASILIMFR